MFDFPYFEILMKLKKRRMIKNNDPQADEKITNRVRLPKAEI
jgi:hypothetical protein